MILFTAGLFLVALAAAGFVLFSALNRKVPREISYVELFCFLGLGTLFNLSLLLLGLPLRAVMAVTCAVAIPGFALRKAKFKLRLDSVSAQAFIAGWALLCGITLSTPYEGWDSRSAWLFQGKIFYYAGGLTREIFDPTLDHDEFAPRAVTDVKAPHAHWHAFSNPGYPKLLGGLSSQAAVFTGYWNNYVPKVALVVLSTLVLLGFLALLEAGLPAVWLFFVTLLYLFSHLTDAYPDAHMSIFFCLGFLFMGRFWQTGERRFLYGLAVAAGVMSSLKEEGLVLSALMFAAAAAGTWALRKKDLRWRELKGDLPLFAAPLVPFFLWAAVKSLWHDLYKNSLNYESFKISHLPLVFERIRQVKPVKTVIYCILFNGELARTLILLAVLAAAAFYFKRKKTLRSPMVWLPLAAAAAYGAILIFVYLVMPYDLTLNAGLTANRTSMPLCMLGLTAAYWILTDLKAKRVLALLFCLVSFTAFKSNRANVGSVANYFRNVNVRTWARMHSPDEVAVNRDFAILVNALKRENVTSYRIVGTLGKDSYFYQKTVEGGWPMRYREQARYVVGARPDIEKTPGCSILSLYQLKDWGEIAIADCR